MKILTATVAQACGNSYPPPPHCGRSGQSWRYSGGFEWGAVAFPPDAGMRTFQEAALLKPGLCVKVSFTVGATFLLIPNKRGHVPLFFFGLPFHLRAGDAAVCQGFLSPGTKCKKGRRNTRNKFYYGRGNLVHWFPRPDCGTAQKMISPCFCLCFCWFPGIFLGLHSHFCSLRVVRSRPSRSRVCDQHSEPCRGSVFTCAPLGRVPSPCEQSP